MMCAIIHTYIILMQTCFITLYTHACSTNLHRTFSSFLAKPVCTAVNLKGVCCPKLGVRWTQELQRELHVDRYEVTVKSPGKVTLTKTFPVNHEKSTYCEPISVPGLSKRGQVVVGVSAKRGGNKPQISSDDFKKSFNKGQY